MTAPVDPNAATPDLATPAPADDQSWQDQLGNLDTLSPDELADLEQRILAAFEEADQAGDLDAMSAAADALDQVRAVVDDQDLDPDGDGDVDPPGVVDQDAVEPLAAAAESAASPPEPTETTAPTDPPPADEPAQTPEETDTDEGTQEDPVDDNIPEDRQPVATVTEPTTIVAGADIPGYAAGSLFPDRNAVADAMLGKLRTFRNAQGGNGDQYIVASIQAPPVSDDRFLKADDAETNLAKIRAVTAPEAIIASGGYCAPLEVKYDIFGLGVADRPVKGALAGFQADRGGIRYVTPPKLGDLAAAVSLWTAANDATPSNPTTKPCVIVTCAPEQTALVDAVTLCLQFGNLMTRAYPELVNRNNEIALVQQARFAETTLLSKITALSTAVSSTKVYGTARDALQAVARAAVNYRARHRMNPEDKLRAIVPFWVLDEIREDVASSFDGDLDIANAVITGWFNDRNVNISWTLDEGFMQAQAVGALNDFPSSFRFWIYAEGTFLVLDGGSLDIGVVRDSTLVGTNDYKTFVETFETVAKVGIEGLVCTVNTGIAGLVGGQLHAGNAP